MDSCKDLGTKWRKTITPYLAEMGVVVFDPTDKPIPIGREDAPARAQMAAARAAGDLEYIRDRMKVVRRVDLRMVDLSSFIIVRLDGSPTWGTPEEVTVALGQQKPVLFWLGGGLSKRNINPWLLSQVPLNYIFESMEGLLDYLKGIDQSPEHPSDRRWSLFNFKELYSNVLRSGEEAASPSIDLPGQELYPLPAVA